MQYEKASEAFLKTLLRVTPKIQQYSIEGETNNFLQRF
jgi:hypothetical protein